jgi:hypothetical protein
MLQAQDSFRNALKKFTSAPDPIKMPLASQQLVSFQNRQWLYTLLQNAWSTNMKTIKLCYQKLHDQDGVILWFCFLTHFAGTTTENLIVAYSQLSETKFQLALFQNNVLKFTNAIRAPLHTLIKAKEEPTFQHFLYLFHGAMDAPNEEFRAFIIDLYTDYRKGGLTKQLSMLDLLDKLDTEYNRINNLSSWVRKEDPHILALTALLNTLQSQFSSLQDRYQALIASKEALPPTPIPTPPPKINKPPPKKEGEPEVIEFENRTWKWCDKCFGSCWNRTHVTKEHQPGKVRSKNRRPPPSNNNNNNSNPSSPPPPPSSPDNTSTNEANITATYDYNMDFV